MFIAPYSVCSIRKVKIHDFYSHNKASQGPANKLLYGCTIDFTFTRPDLKGLWDCPWIPNLCATLSLSSWHPLPSVNWQDYSLNRISLPFILRTTGQSGRWQPSDSIQMEMKASGGMVLFVKHWRKLLGSGSSSAVPNWVLRLWLHLLWDFSTRNLILNTVIIRVVCRLNLWSDYHKIYRICCRAIKMTFFLPQACCKTARHAYTSIEHIQMWNISLEALIKQNTTLPVVFGPKGPADVYTRILFSPLDALHSLYYEQHILSQRRTQVREDLIVCWGDVIHVSFFVEANYAQPLWR